MIFILIGLLLIAWMVQRYSLQHGFDRLTYHMETGKKVVDPGEPFTIQTMVENDKWMMLPFLKILEDVPLELDLIQGERLDKGNKLIPASQLVAECYLAGRQKLVMSRVAKVEKRGWYRFSHAELLAGDFLGISYSTKSFSYYRELVVKPAPVASQALDRAMGGFLGDVSVRRFWMEDPMYLLRYRDYTGREPMKSISWTMSAKNNKLMVKEYDHTAEPNCTVVLDLSYHNYQDNLESAAELCFSMARTVCEQLETNGFTYNFITNAETYGSAGSVQEVYQGKGPNHLEGILEILGRSGYRFAGHLDSLLQRVIAGRTPGRACIIISLIEAQQNERHIERIRELTGCEVLVLKPEFIAAHAEDKEDAYGFAHS